MKIQYISDVTNKAYDTKEELEKAEAAALDKKNAREARAKEVEDAMKAARDANKHAREVMSKFCADYGAYHTTIHDTKDFDPFDWFTDWFLF